jgi:putative ABC transport system permease protein
MFQALAGVTTVGHNLTGAGTPERLLGEEVTWNYFSVLGAAPTLGRVFDPSEDRPGAHVVISQPGLWQTRFGSDDEIDRAHRHARQHAVSGRRGDAGGLHARHACMNTGAVTFWTPAGYPPDLLENHGDHGSTSGRLAPRASLARRRPS